jgi:outer membrane protein OmpA-like peptidoglycan-associated protein
VKQGQFVRIILSIIFLVQIHCSHAQKSEYGTCANAVNIFENGDFRLVQNAEPELKEDLNHYSSLRTFTDKKQLWLNFSADKQGELTFNASSEESVLQFVVLKAEKGNPCAEITTGLAEIVRLHSAENSKIVGLDYKIDIGVLYALDLNEGDQIVVLIGSDPTVKSNINLSWNFIPKEAAQASKVVDRRLDDFATTQRFKVRDKANGKSLIANFAIEGNRDIDGLYMGSEFLFNLDRNCKLSVKCDTEGYFYKDTLIEVNAFEDNEFVIDLERIAKGKSISIQSIEFIPGSSEIKESSLPDLRRLRDFLALNANVHIEIQGHVFADGDNTLAAQRVSEARAKRVMKYLVDNGIDSKRMVAVGYGNTKPIYEKPRFYYEEQANRRVEIVVQ